MTGEKPPRSILDKMLTARGLKTYTFTRTRDLLVLPHMDAEKIDKFYTHMCRYSFRLLLRDIIKNQEAFIPKDLTRFSSIESVKKDLKFLIDIGLIKKVKKKGYALAHGPVRTFGETLEWFVAETIAREFLGDVIWGVRFEGSKHGGDYDIIASLGDALLYAEVKSSPPRHIMQQEISAFFDRIFDLLPDLSIFLMDTELRMKDKLVPMFEEELLRRYGKRWDMEYPVKRLHQEIFHIRYRIFLMNTKRSLAENLRICYRAFLRSRLLL